MGEENGCSADIGNSDTGGPEAEEEEVVDDAGEVPSLEVESDCWMDELE